MKRAYWDVTVSQRDGREGFRFQVSGVRNSTSETSILTPETRNLKPWLKDRSWPHPPEVHTYGPKNRLVLGS